MYLIIVKDYEDTYDSQNIYPQYKRCKTKKQAEKIVIDLLYENIEDYFNNTQYNPNLKDRNYYSMNNVNELINLVETTFIKYKYTFSIEKI